MQMLGKKFGSPLEMDPHGGGSSVVAIVIVIAVVIVIIEIVVVIEIVRRVDLFVV